MKYGFEKYKDIDAFVKNKPKGGARYYFTILHECRGLVLGGEGPEFMPQCFGCLFCVFNDAEVKKAFLDFWGDGVIKNLADTAFLGDKVDMPSAKKQIRNRIKNIEEFTASSETSHIQPWAAGILKNVCREKTRIGLEVPVFNRGYERNGRLDICALAAEKLLILESKTTLDDALADERFVEQQVKYTEVIEKSTSDYVYLTLIGGTETDLFPISSPYCTGTAGEKTHRFYSLLENNGIRFISANAILAMACKFCAGNDGYGWDAFLYPLFKDSSVIGLVSAGKVVKRGSEYIIEKI